MRVQGEASHNQNKTFVRVFKDTTKGMFYHRAE